MKPLLKKILRPLLAISLSLSAAAVITTAVVASKEEPTKAEALYSPSTHYEVTNTSSEFTSYYSSISGTGSTMLSTLRSLDSSKKRTTFDYDDMGSNTNTGTNKFSSSPFIYTDFVNSTNTDSNGQPYSTTISSFYTGGSITSSGGYWNKEHVWPNSRGGSKVENNLLMPRPTLVSENSSRGNSSFVEGMNHSSNGWDPETAFSSNYYPGIRGECARIIFYCVVASSSLSLLDNANSSTSAVGKLSDLIKWHYAELPTQREINRNNGAEYLQGNRNPFVDHPEYVTQIWGANDSSVPGNSSTIANYCTSHASTYSSWTPGSTGGSSTSTDPSITVSPSTTSVAVNSTVQLTASLSNITNYSNVSWSSSDTSIATVSRDTATSSSSTATVTGKKAGTATITCMYGSSVYNTATVTVYTPGSSTNATFNFASGGNVSSTSGSTTGVSFTTAQGSAQNTPAYNDSSYELRMYYASSGSGNTFTLTPDSGYTITGVTITASSTSYTPAVKYKVDGGNDQTGAWNSTTMTISGVSASSSFVFRNANTTNTQLRIKSVDVTLQTSGSSTTKTLSSITLNTTNTTKTFTVGDTFNYTGLVVTANYSDSSSATVTPTSVSSPNMSTTGSKTITVSYTEGDVTKTATYTITVNAATKTLSSIAVSNQTTTFTVGDTFSFGGTVTATYSDSSTADVTSSASFSGYNMSNAGNQTVTVSYTYSGTTKTTTYSITVNSQSSSSEEYFQKVTSSSGLTSGDYLIVYESGNLAFNGGLSTIDAKNNSISVTISNSKIDATTTTKAAKFTIDTSAGTIKSASGYYIGQGSNSNGLGQNTNASTYSNTLTYSSGDVDIVSSGAYLRYNAGTSDLRFRYYKSSSYTNQQAIQLYKYYTNSTNSIRLNKDSLTLVMGGSAGSITATPSGSGTVTWTSSDENVATVSNGSVTAVGTGTATITATYGTASATCAVTVTGATGTSPYANGIPYKMYFTNSSDYFFTGSMGTGNQQYYGMTSTTYSEGVDVYFEANGSGQNIYMKDGTTKNYFFVAVSGTHYNFSFDSTSAPLTAWVYDSTASCMAFPINGVKYTFGNSGSYTTFSAYNVDEYSSNYKVQFGLTGEGYANIFFNAINCDSTGKNAPTFNSGYTWTSLGTLYNGLLDGAKSELQSATASESGSTYLEKATYRYDYIIAKYGVAKYANFINRTVKTLPLSVSIFSGINSDNSTAIIVIASIIGLTSAFGLVMLKKRKEN